ncbi:hypothetical protein FACS1894111_12190 [Clostridia bacterium]|nr:hypothetical protein FACS1894111_12190 [Clostridia bacterium]
MSNKYDITKMEELHKLRADHYEETKHLTPMQQTEEINKRAKSAWEYIDGLKRASIYK